MTEHERSRRRGVPLWVVTPHRSVVRTLAACDAMSVLHVVTESPASSATALAEALRDRTALEAVAASGPTSASVQVVSKIPLQPAGTGADEQGRRTRHV